jgi:hypothetical protein
LAGISAARTEAIVGPHSPKGANKPSNQVAFSSAPEGREKAVDICDIKSLPIGNGPADHSQAATNRIVLLSTFGGSIFQNSAACFCVTAL